MLSDSAVIKCSTFILRTGALTGLQYPYLLVYTTVPEQGVLIDLDPTKSEVLDSTHITGDI